MKEFKNLQTVSTDELLARDDRGQYPGVMVMECHLGERFLASSEYQDEEVPQYKARLGENAKWRVISCLQKAIRRGDEDYALKCAYALQHSDEDWYLWRRLAIICLEDICLGNQEIGATALMLGVNKKFREDQGGWRVTAALVRQMCRSVKNRSACHLSVTTMGRDDARVEMLKRKPEHPDLFQPEFNLHSLLAGWGLIGNLKMEIDGVQAKTVKQPELFLELVDERFNPSILGRYLCEQGFKYGGEFLELTVSALFAYNMAAEHEEIDILKHEVPEPVKIKGLMDSCYDMHTREGKKAYAYFSKAYKPFEEWFKKANPGKNRVECIGHLMFMTDSDIVDVSLGFKDEIHYQRESRLAQLRYLGIDGELLDESREMMLAPEAKEMMLKAKRRVIEDA